MTRVHELVPTPEAVLLPQILVRRHNNGGPVPIRPIPGVDIPRVDTKAVDIPRIEAIAISRIETVAAPIAITGVEATRSRAIAAVTIAITAPSIATAVAISRVAPIAAVPIGNCRGWRGRGTKRNRQGCAGYQ